MGLVPAPPHLHRWKIENPNIFGYRTAAVSQAHFPRWIPGRGFYRSVRNKTGYCSAEHLKEFPWHHPNRSVSLYINGTLTRVHKPGTTYLACSMRKHPECSSLHLFTLTPSVFGTTFGFNVLSAIYHRFEFAERFFRKYSNTQSHSRCYTIVRLD